MCFLLNITHWFSLANCLTGSQLSPGKSRTCQTGHWPPQTFSAGSKSCAITLAMTRSTSWPEPSGLISHLLAIWAMIPQLLKNDALFFCETTLMLFKLLPLFRNSCLFWSSIKDDQYVFDITANVQSLCPPLDNGDKV